MSTGTGWRAAMAVLALVLNAWLGGGPVSAGTPSPSPERFVADLSAQVVAELRDPSGGEAERLERIDRLTAGAFDLERTARIALGRYWKGAPEADRREFAALFKDYVLTSYGRRFRQFADRTVRVIGTSGTGQDVIVATAVEGGASPIRLDWRLSAADAGWKVLDIAVEGVSLLVTFRNEFAAVIERSGGRLAGLLDELRSRVAAERALLSG